jgi:hypothetical protein
MGASVSLSSFLSPFLLPCPSLLPLSLLFSPSFLYQLFSPLSPSFPLPLSSINYYLPSLSLSPPLFYQSPSFLSFSSSFSPLPSFPLPFSPSQEERRESERRGGRGQREWEREGKRREGKGKGDRERERERGREGEGERGRRKGRERKR